MGSNNIENLVDLVEERAPDLVRKFSFNSDKESSSILAKKPVSILMDGPNLNSIKESNSNERSNLVSSNSSNNSTNSSGEQVDKESVIVESLKFKLKRKVDSVFDLDQLYLNLRKKFLIEKIDSLTDDEVFKINRIVHPTSGQLMALYDIKLTDVNKSTKKNANESLEDKSLEENMWRAPKGNYSSDQLEAKSQESDDNTLINSIPDDATIINSISDDATLINSDDATELNYDQFSSISESTSKTIEMMYYKSKKKSEEKEPIDKSKTINSFLDKINLNNTDDDGNLLYDKNVVKTGFFEFYTKGKRRYLCPNCPSVTNYDRDYKKHTDCHKIYYNEREEVQCVFCNWTISKKIKHLVSKSHLNSHSIINMVKNYGLDLSTLNEESKKKKWFVEHLNKVDEDEDDLDMNANYKEELNYSFSNLSNDHCFNYSVDKSSSSTDTNDKPLSKKLRNLPPVDYNDDYNDFLIKYKMFRKKMR